MGFGALVLLGVFWILNFGAVGFFLGAWGFGGFGLGVLRVVTEFWALGDLVLKWVSQSSFGLEGLRGFGRFGMNLGLYLIMGLFRDFGALGVRALGVHGFRGLGNFRLWGFIN